MLCCKIFENQLKLRKCRRHVLKYFDRSLARLDYTSYFYPLSSAGFSVSLLTRMHAQHSAHARSMKAWRYLCSCNSSSSVA